MKLWTIWVQSNDHTWLEDAWDDESTAGNSSGWTEAVDKAEAVAKANGGAMRVLCVEIPDRVVFGLFDVPVVQATNTEPI